MKEDGYFINIPDYNIYRITPACNKKISRLLTFIHASYYLSGVPINMINFLIFVALKNVLFNSLKFSYVISKIIRAIKVISIVDFNRDFNKELKTSSEFKKHMFTLMKENSFSKCWKVYDYDCIVLLKEVN